MAKGVKTRNIDSFREGLMEYAYGRCSQAQAAKIAGMSVPTFRKYANMHFLGIPFPDTLFKAIDNIKFCPICGRKLCDETETTIEHFLKSEIERSKLRMNVYAECFDGVHVDNDTRKKLLESHIRFCKNALKQCMDA